MSRDTAVTALRQPGAIDDPLTELPVKVPAACWRRC